MVITKYFSPYYMALAGKILLFIWRFTRRLVALVLLLLIALFILIQLPPVQSFLAKKTADYFSKELKTTVKVGGLQFRLLNKVAVEDVLVLDQKSDTLAAIGSLKLLVSDWFYLRPPNEIKYVGLDDVVVRAYRKDSPVWNYQFLVDYFKSDKPKDTTKSKPFLFSLEQVELNRVRLYQLDEWKGLSLIAGLDGLNVLIDKIDLERGDVRLSAVDLNGPQYRELRRSGNWKAADSIAYYQEKPVDTTVKKSEPSEPSAPFHLAVGKITMNNGLLQFLNRPTEASTPGLFDESDIIIRQLAGTVEGFDLHGDTVRATVKNLQATERSGLQVKQLNTKFTMHSQLMEFDSLLLATDKSKLGPYYAMRYTSIDDMSSFIDKVRLSANFNKATLHVQDIAYFTSYLKKNNQVIQLSGKAEGTISDFTIRNLDASTGSTRLTGTYAMKGLVDIDKSRITFNTGGSQFNLDDLKPWAPDVDIYNNQFLKKFGTSRFVGSFEGTINQFVAKGRIDTKAGMANARFSYNNSKGKDGGFRADIAKAEVNGGYLLGVTSLGNIDFEGSAYTNSGSPTAPLYLEGLIRNAVYNNYTYNNVLLNGRLKGDTLLAGITLDDQNLAGNFLLNINLAKKLPEYKANGRVDIADLKALNFTKDSIVYSGSFDVDFKGDDVDDFTGYARLNQGSIYNGRELLSFDSLVLSAKNDTANRERLVEIHSNNIDASLKGRFRLSTIHRTFQSYLSKYYPSLIAPPTGEDNNENVTFSIRTRLIEPYLRVLDTSLVGFNNSTVLGYIDVAEKQLLMNANIPYGGYGNIGARGFVMQAAGSDDGFLTALAQVETVSIDDSMSFPRARLVVNTFQDTTNLKLQTESYGALGDAQIAVDVITKANGLEAKFYESSLIFNNKKWSIDKGGTIEVRDRYLISDGLAIRSLNSEIALRTVPSNDGNWNDLQIKLRDVSLNDFLPFFLKEPSLSAQVTGLTVVQDPLGKPVIETDLKAKDLIFENEPIGDAKLKGTVDLSAGTIQANFTTDNPQGELLAGLNITLPDSSRDGLIDLDIALKDQQIKFLNTYLSVVFQEFEGLATGNLRLVGAIDKPALVGRASLRKARLVPEYTKVVYTVDSADIEFGDNYIDFGRMVLKDSKGRQGEVKGRFYHRFFDSLSFNLNVNSAGMEVLNTKSRDNDLFYGNAVAKASFDLTGPLADLKIKISGTPTDSSMMFIKLQDTRQNDEADFIVFKQYGRELETLIDSNSSNLRLDLDLTANPLLAMNVILDPVTNDVIRGRGAGNIKISTSTKGGTSMTGRYDIETGNYNYSFQTLIRKPFVIKEEGENYVEWTGDPYNAKLNLEADYLASNVGLRSLISGEQGRTLLDQSAQNFKGDVWVKIVIKGMLSSPDIDFRIEFPPGSSMRGNFSANELLRRIEDDQSELLKQVTYLIVFGSFAPYQQGGGGVQSPGADLAISTVSELLSNQMSKILTNVLGQVFNDRSLSVDVSTNFYNSSQLVGGNVVASTGYDRFAVDLSLNKTFLNNRIVVNLGSNFDAGLNSTTSNGFQFLPDISVEFVLTPNRRLRFILFKKDDLDFSGRRNRAGASISYRHDYDRLFGKDKNEVLVVENTDGN